MIYTFARLVRPISDLLSFRNSEVHVAQLGEMKRRNSGRSSALNLSDVMSPSSVARVKLGRVSKLGATVEDTFEHDTVITNRNRMAPE